MLLVLGIGAGVLIGSRMAGSSRQATSSSSKTVQESPGSSESLWHGKDIRESGEGVYPGMDKERACTQAGVEAAYWLISGSGSQREEELYKRFFLPNLISADVDPRSPPLTGSTMVIRPLRQYPWILLPIYWVRR